MVVQRLLVVFPLHGNLNAVEIGYTFTSPSILLGAYNFFWTCFSILSDQCCLTNLEICHDCLLKLITLAALEEKNAVNLSGL